MGEPREATKGEELRTLSLELISIESALNMEPSLIEHPLQDAHFLSETDAWAAHALQHAQQAFKLVAEVQQTMKDLGVQAAKLENAIRERELGTAQRLARALQNNLFKLSC